MRTLVIAATHAEVQPLLTYFQLDGKTKTTFGDFEVCISGVGIAATCFALGRKLHGQYSQVINLGIAGAFDRSLALGSVVNITKDIFSELGAENNQEFLSLSSMGFGAVEFSGLHLNSLPSVQGITVNKVHGNASSIADVVARLHPQTESMEGAAALYCCQMDKVSCLQVRAISNYVEARATERWNVPLAIHNLNDWAITHLTEQKS